MPYCLVHRYLQLVKKRTLKNSVFDLEANTLLCNSLHKVFGHVLLTEEKIPSAHKKFKLPPILVNINFSRNVVYQNINDDQISRLSQNKNALTAA